MATTVEAGTSTKIMSCSCANRFQDSRYGVGKRVHNKMGMKPIADSSFRCTVCGNTKDNK